MMLANIFDSTEATRLGKKFKPMKRPWPERGSQKLGKTTMSPKEARAALKRNRG